MPVSAAHSDLLVDVDVLLPEVAWRATASDRADALEDSAEPPLGELELRVRLRDIEAPTASREGRPSA